MQTQILQPRLTSVIKPSYRWLVYCESKLLRIALLFKHAFERWLF